MKALLGPRRCANNKSEAIDGVYPWEGIQWYGNLRERRGPPLPARMISIQLTESIPQGQANSRQQLLVKDTGSSRGDLASGVTPFLQVVNVGRKEDWR